VAVGARAGAAGGQLSRPGELAEKVSGRWRADLLEHGSSLSIASLFPILIYFLKKILLNYRSATSERRANTPSL